MKRIGSVSEAKRRLAGAEDAPRFKGLEVVVPMGRNKQPRKREVAFSADLYRQLVSTTSQGLEMPVLLLTLFQEVLRRYTGQAVITIEFHRDGSATSLLTLEENASVRETVRRTQSLLRLTDQMHVSARNVADGCFKFTEGLDVRTVEDRQGTGAPIRFTLRSFGGTLGGSIEYEPKTWEPAVIDSLKKHYLHLLRAALAGLDMPICDLEILSESDKQTFQSWNRTGRHYPRVRVDELFRQRVEEAPDNPAVTFEGQTISYRALYDQTGRLATRLRSLGVGPGTLVGVCMDRCNEMVIALLAIFRAGGAYLPLDPSFPAERIAFMQEDAGPLVVITQPHLRDKFSFTAPHVLSIDCLGEGDDMGDCSNPLETPALPEAKLDDLAYVLYTSGSTGKPKGVQITQRALTNLLTAVALDLPIGKADVFLATSSISFDISAFEIFAPLISGARLVVAPRSVAVSGDLLAKAARDTCATLLQATPSGWRILLEAGWEGQPGLKMLTAGEPLDRTLAARLLECGAGLWNLYGPTEATIYATGCKVMKRDPKITVGRPLANYTTYVLDRNRRAVPIGAIGELYLGGIGVASGYLNRPELTAEKFIGDPFCNDPARRLYRTGDLARFLPDGQIELLGRADNQVKLRGYRIELEEIENLLDSHPSIRKSVVKVTDLGEGDQRLVAYVVPQSSGTVDEAGLREYAFRGLPWYMVPAAFVAMPAFPLTPNGKIDRKSLPLPADLKRAISAVETEKPSDDLDAAVLDSFRSHLRITNLNLDENFFEVGGHSLLAARVFAQIERRLGVKLNIGLLAECSTPRLVAERIRQMRNAPARCLVPMQTAGSLPPLYLVHHLLGDILLYRAVAEWFVPDRPVFGIQAPADLADRCELCSLESLAALYIEEILDRQPVGPFHLAGFSSGSVLAFEMARQLEQRGHQVGMLALIDGDIKAPGPALSKLARYRKVVIRKACKIAFKLGDELKEGPSRFITKRLHFLWLSWSVKNLESARKGERQGRRTIEQALILAENGYRPQPYPGTGLLIRFDDEAWKFGPDPLMGWSTLIQAGIDIIDLPGSHATGMRAPRVSQLAGALASHMKGVEAAAPCTLRVKAADLPVSA